MDVTLLKDAHRDSDVFRAYMEQMGVQTVALPGGLVVTFSLEKGQPCGDTRHLSVSVEGKAPSPALVWMLAEEFGFWGGLHCCTAYIEQVDEEQAVNLVQPIADLPAGRA